LQEPEETTHPKICGSFEDAMDIANRGEHGVRAFRCLANFKAAAGLNSSFRVFMAFVPALFMQRAGALPDAAYLRRPYWGSTTENLTGEQP
jgi:hypothetical protein